MSLETDTVPSGRGQNTEFNPGKRPGRNTTRNPRNRTKWSRDKNNKNNFQGKSKEMNGQIFQLQVKRRQKGKFQDTIEQLQVYASGIYKKDTKQLKTLFTQLETPTIVKPEPPKSNDIVDDAIYQEEINNILKIKKFRIHTSIII